MNFLMHICPLSLVHSTQFLCRAPKGHYCQSLSWKTVVLFIL